MNIALLNQVSALCVANGIKPTKMGVIALCIKGLKEAGMETADAIDAVLGAGTTEKAYNEVYDMIRANASA